MKEIKQDDVLNADLTAYVNRILKHVNTYQKLIEQESRLMGVKPMTELDELTLIIAMMLPFAGFVSYERSVRKLKSAQVLDAWRETFIQLANTVKTRPLPQGVPTCPPSPLTQ